MVIDIIFAMFLLWGMYIGYSRGIIKTVFFIASLVIGLIAAFKFSPAATQFLGDLFSTENPLMLIAGFVLCFFLTMFIIRMFAGGIEKMFRSANINFINQTVGGIVMAIVFTFLYSMMIWFADESHIISDKERASSMSYPLLKEFPKHTRSVTSKLKPIFMDFWTSSMLMMDKLQDAAEREESEPTFYDFDEE